MNTPQTPPAPPATNQAQGTKKRGKATTTATCSTCGREGLKVNPNGTLPSHKARGQYDRCTGFLPVDQVRIKRLEKALRDIDEQCAECFLACENCGHENQMKDLDIRIVARDALAAGRAGGSR